MTAFNSSQGPGPAAVARTLLFVPGNQPERFAKAAATAADVVIVDLEDAVREENKTAARDAAALWLSADGSAAVRVNGSKSVYYQRDVNALSGLPGLRAVVVPMAEDPSALAALHMRLGPDVEIVALIETTLGVLRAVQLASVPGMTRLAFGHLDYAADCWATPWLTTCRSVGVTVYDDVTFRVSIYGSRRGHDHAPEMRDDPPML